MTHDDDDALSALLDRSAPRVPGPTLGEQTALARMAAAAPTGGRTTRRGRGAIIGAVGAVVALAGTYTAAAATDNLPWDKEYVDPDLLFTYTLPSGARCEEHLIAGTDEASKVVRDLAHSTDLVAQADVDAEIASLREGPSTTTLGDGSVVPSGPDTPYYFSPDREYSMAMDTAVGKLIQKRLDEKGIHFEGDQWSSSAELQCPGADWYPGMSHDISKLP